MSKIGTIINRTPEWFDKTAPRGLMTWNYCAQGPRYFCECNFYNPCELEKKDAPCPKCGTVHSVFVETGL